MNDRRRCISMLLAGKPEPTRETVDFSVGELSVLLSILEAWQNAEGLGDRSATVTRVRLRVGRALGRARRRQA